MIEIEWKNLPENVQAKVLSLLNPMKVLELISQLPPNEQDEIQYLIKEKVLTN